jgi:hypothetical protein
VNPSIHPCSEEVAQKTAIQDSDAHPLQNLIDSAGHLGLWPGLYAIGAMCCFLELTGMGHGGERSINGVTAVGLTTIGIYLLDRVKFRRKWIDPADCFALPGRYRFLCDHQAACRYFAIAMLAGGVLFGEGVSLWAPVVVCAGAISALLYAAAPRGQFPRVKDMPLLKNLYTSGGLVGFVCVVSFAIGGRLGHHLATWRLHAAEVGAGLLLARVFLDAALCDVGDEEADRAFGTITAVNHFGAARARQWATAVQIFMAIGLLLVPAIPFAARAGWSIAWLVSSIVLPAVSIEHLADFVDLRFALEAFFATIVMRLI